MTRCPPARRSWCSPAPRTSPVPTAIACGTGRRRPGREQHRRPVGRPEPDLHLARLAPGVPARVRRSDAPASRVSDRQAARRPAPPATRPTPALLNDGNADGSISTWAATKKQAAQKLGLLLAGQGRDQHPDAGHRPVRQVHPGPERAAAVRRPTDRPASRATCANPVPVPGERRALRHAVPDRHRAQRRPAPAGHRPQPGDPAGRPDAGRRRHVASADFADQPPGTYDDEMLNAHFACGDGRCNENIALSHDPPDLPLRARPAGGRHQEHADQRPTRPCWPRLPGDAHRSARRRPEPASATASACSRPPAS